MNTHRGTNNLNFIRFFAAAIVIIGHSQVLLGQAATTVLGGPIHALGVIIFFAVSGYLISDSWERNPNIIAYFTNRALRIFPALIVVVTLLALIVGPIFSSLPLYEYFTHPQFLGYFKNVALYAVYSLPAVFEKNFYANAVNGSLWSLAPEFFCYIIVAIFGLVPSRFRGYLFGFTFFLLAAFIVYRLLKNGHQIVIYGTDADQAATVMIYFMLGAVIRLFRIPLSGWVAIVPCTIYLMIPASASPFVPMVLVWILVPYVVLTFGLKSFPFIRDWGKYGDFSYGLYLYAFPIQQMLFCGTDGQVSPTMMTIVTFILSLCCAIISWYLVEKPFLMLKIRAI